jgi:hypothetical protein
LPIKCRRMPADAGTSAGPDVMVDEIPSSCDEP